MSLRSLLENIGWGNSREQRDRRWVTCIFVFAISIVGSATASAGGRDWAMFRGGPELTGWRDVELPGKPDLLWTFDTGGPVVSSAAVSGGRVFVGSKTGKIHALSLSDGKEVWTAATGGAVEASPCAVGGRIFVGSSDGNLYALDEDTGDILWIYATADRILGGASWAHEPGGKAVWILVGGYDGGVHCVDAVKGERVWLYQTESFVNGTPAVHRSGMVVVGGCDANLYVLSLADGEEIGRLDTGAYIASSVALAGGFGYVGHYENEVIACDLEKFEIAWRYRNRSFPFFSSAAVGPRLVVIGGRDKTLHGIDRASGEVVWEFPVRDRIDSSPVLVRNRVIFGSDDGRIYGVDPATGEEAWSYQIGAPIKASPALAEGKIVIGAEDGVVYAFEFR